MRYAATAAAAEANNFVLVKGEQGYTADDHVLKVGDGVTPWNDLEPVAGGGGASGGADAGGIGFPYPLAEYGMFTAAVDPGQVDNASTIPKGVVRVPVPAGWTIEGVRYAVSTLEVGETGLNGFAAYDDTGDLITSTSTGPVWSTLGWHNIAFDDEIPPFEEDGALRLAYSYNGAGTAQTIWKNSGLAAWVNSGTFRRSAYGYTFGSSWPSTFNFETGGTLNGWIPCFGFYGTKA